MIPQDLSEQRRYDCFIHELTQLSRRYGMTIQAVGGVRIADKQGDFATVAYVEDISSGDVMIAQ